MKTLLLLSLAFVLPVQAEDQYKQPVVTAFGEALVAELTPQVQLQFVYQESISSDILNKTAINSGTITQADAMLVATSSTNTAGKALSESKNPVKYNSGQGGLARFTALFTECTADSRQEVGLGDDNDAFLIGCDGDRFGVIRRSGGVETFTGQDYFSEDSLFGYSKGMVLDITKLNVFEIRFQYLGAGEIQFCIEDPKTGKFFIFHRIKYANNNTTPSLRNPTMPLRVLAENTGNTTSIITKSASMAGFVEGKDIGLGLIHSPLNTKTGITTETNVLTVRPKATLTGGTVNKVRARLEFVSFSNEGTKDVTIRITRNATLGGSTSYSDVEAGVSTLEFDTAGTTVTSGDPILPFTISKNSGDIIRLSDFNIIVPVGDSITFSAESSSSTAVTISATFRELF